MKATGFIRILSMLLLVTAAFQAPAQQTVKITNGEWSPYLSEHLPGYGSASRVVTEAFANEGVDVSYGFFPWARAIEEAARGTDWVGSIIWTRSDEREKTFLYSDPVVALNDVFFHVKGVNFDWQDVDDLADVRIGMTLGYFYGQELDDAEKYGRIYVERASSDLLNLRKLLRGRVDIVAINEDVGYSIINENFKPGDTHAFTNHPRPFRVVDYHLIVSKKAPNAQQIIDLFNTGLRKLKAEGRYAQIVD